VPYLQQCLFNANPNHTTNPNHPNSNSNPPTVVLLY